MKKTHDSKIQAFSLDAESINNLNELSEALKMKKSTLIRLLINQAKKNSNLCRMIERDRTQEIVEDFVKRKGLPWERTKISVYTELERKEDKPTSNPLDVHKLQAEGTHYTEVEPWNKEIRRTIEIARTKWLDED